MRDSSSGALAELIRRSDYWRRSSGSARGPIGHKEWMHFSVLSPDVDLLINFSLVDDRHRREVPSLVFLVRPREGPWDGWIERPTLARVSGGGMALSMGESRVDFEGGEFRIEAKTSRRDLTATLCLRPVARPALTTSVPLGRGASMKWAVVPRLVADGELQVGDRRIELRAAPAYHDHNWGSFEWGGDFAWEWGIVLGEQNGSPCTVILQRITDRGRHRVVSQGMLVWRGGSHARTLHGGSVEFRNLGLRRAGGALRLPPVMSLVSPGSAADLPDRLEVRGRAGEDSLEVMLDIGEPVQIGVPDDRGLGTTIVSETTARARVSGSISGESLSFEAPAIVEFNRAGA